MSLEKLLWLSASVAEAAVIVLLFYKRVWRAFPLFFAYSIWTLFGSAAAYLILRGHPSTSLFYVTAYLTYIIVDSTLLFGVYVELAWSILRPVRSSLPRGALFIVTLAIIGIGGAIWPFAAYPGASHLSREMAALMRLQQTLSILSVLVFAALAGFSQLLSLGWRDRELQIANGLGFYSLVGLAVAFLHTHQSTLVQYGHLNEIAIAGYLCSMLYWIVSFSHKEAERRAFTPQMQNMLLAVAGAARTTRVALEDSSAAKEGKRKM
ncbi:MAG: hypothetical protein ACRD3N_14325 [Terracidiphilus sp.]